MGVWLQLTQLPCMPAPLMSGESLLLEYTKCNAKVCWLCQSDFASNGAGGGGGLGGQERGK